MVRGLERWLERRRQWHNVNLCGSFGRFSGALGSAPGAGLPTSRESPLDALGVRQNPWPRMDSRPPEWGVPRADRWLGATWVGEGVGWRWLTVGRLVGSGYRPGDAIQNQLKIQSGRALAGLQIRERFPCAGSGEFGPQTFAIGLPP